MPRFGKTNILWWLPTFHRDLERQKIEWQINLVISVSISVWLFFTHLSHTCYTCLLEAISLNIDIALTFLNFANLWYLELMAGFCADILLSWPHICWKLLRLASEISHGDLRQNFAWGYKENTFLRNITKYIYG